MPGSIIPSPLHPAVVHLPIALTVLLPVAAAGALWAIRRGARPRPAWGITVGLLGLLLGSAWLAVATGEQQKERVARVVTEQALEQHEEAAELFLVAAGVVLLISGGGLARGRVGSAARRMAALGTLGLVAAAWNVGHSGGDLVYRHGAASAYTSTRSASAVLGVAPNRPGFSSTVK